TTAESHSRIIVMEVMGRDAGWLTGTSIFGGGSLGLIPEFEITKERKEVFFETVREAYMHSRNRCLVIPVSEGIRWYNENTGKVEMVYASSELDEYGHPRFGGVSGVVASEITKKLGIEARAQISGYYARAGHCRHYDRRLTTTLADKVVDLLLREDYGQMPVMKRIVPFAELEEYNTTSIDMGAVGNKPMSDDYYDINRFSFTDAYRDFLAHILEHPMEEDFRRDFPIVIPD
ncbi:MAG: 6-phosphofructokinase, partial [bacterium]